MKTSVTLLLLLSLALNATFAFFLVRRDTEAVAPATRAPSVAKWPIESITLSPDVWSKLQPDDLRGFVEQLRAAGFPPEIVRAILSAQLYEANTARRKALTGGDTLPFWKDGQRDPKIQAALWQIDREQRKLLREILGADAESEDPMSRLNQNRGLAYLPAEKADEVRQLLRQYDERRADLFAAGFNFLTDREKVTALEREQHDALARVLSPAELLEYDLRASNTANSLREELSVFNPTEAEFRSLYQLRAPFDERFKSDSGMLILSSDPAGAARRDAQKLLNEQIKAQLGPTRAAEYERMTDFNYRRTSQLVARLELPPDTTNQLFALQKDFEQRRNELYRGPTVNREQATERLAVLQQEAIARVTPLLGNARAVEAYKQYGGQWLASMTPRPAPPPPAAPKS